MMAEQTTLLAVGERDGKVVLQFPRAVRECVIDAETARQAGEAIARSAYTVAHGVAPAQHSSQISADRRRRLKARATLVLRTMQDRGATPDVAASHLVDALLADL